MNGLRHLKPDPELNVTYEIEVRARPVQHPYAKHFATHCFLALVAHNGEVVDSLSFDPSNSVGWSDADPTNYSRGRKKMESDCQRSTWTELAEAFKLKAGKCSYVLGQHNCCHAVMDALVATNLTHADEGIAFAREANATWHTATGTLQTPDFIKKNV